MSDPMNRGAVQFPNAEVWHMLRPADDAASAWVTLCGRVADPARVSWAQAIPSVDAAVCSACWTYDAE